MHDKENLHSENDTSAEGSEQEDFARREILRQVEAGEIDVSEGLKRLEEIEAPGEEDVVSLLESGDIDVEEAIHRIEAGEEEVHSEAADPPQPDISQRLNWRSWWYVFFGFGLAGLATGGWLASVGGWWWLCAAPSLFFGLLITSLAVASINSPWLHVNIDTGEDSWPRHIFFGLPVPFGIASWALKRWGTRVKGFDDTAIDELILSLEGSVSGDSPIVIDVHDDEDSGERIQVYLG